MCYLLWFEFISSLFLVFLIYTYLLKQILFYFLTKAVTVESMEKIAAYLVDTVLSQNSAITSTEHVWTGVTVATKVFFVQKVRLSFYRALIQSTKLLFNKITSYNIWMIFLYIYCIHFLRLSLNSFFLIWLMFCYYFHYLPLGRVYIINWLECSDGFYGEECSSSCGHCLNDSACHHVTGTCDQGCEPGYQAPNCTEGILCNIKKVFIRFYFCVRKLSFDLAYRTQFW